MSVRRRHHPFRGAISTLEAVSDLPQRDQFVLAKLADGVDPDVARTEIQAAIEEFPQADLQTNAEFREQQEEQINQLLAIITGLLSMAMVIALVGITITLALSVFERTREIELFHAAVGMTRRQLRRTVRWEAVIVSVFGAVVGIVVGLSLGIALVARRARERHRRDHRAVRSRRQACRTPS